MDKIHNDRVNLLNIQDKVFSEQVKILHNNLLTSVPSNFVAAFIVFSELYRMQGNAVILGWFVAVCLVSIFRLISLRFYRQHQRSDNLHLMFFMTGTTLSALLWGIMASILMPESDLLHQMMTIVIIAGVTAGASQTLSANLKVSLTHLLIILIPLSIWIFLQGALVYTLLGITVIAYLVFMLLTSVRGHELLATALFLKYENQALIERISISNAQLVDYSNTLYQQSMHDALTGLFNRRYLDETLPRELQRVIREQRTLCVAMLDLDCFKTFNDTHGHVAGDEVLRYIGTLMQEAFRGSDISCRFGGEEFLVVLIDTDMVSAEARLEAFRELVKKGQILFQGQFLPPMTVSIGVAEAPAQGATAEEIIRAADKALYYAKKAGRDRIEKASIAVP